MGISHFSTYGNKAAPFSGAHKLSAALVNRQEALLTKEDECPSSFGELVGAGGLIVTGKAFVLATFTGLAGAVDFDEFVGFDEAVGFAVAVGFAGFDALGELTALATFLTAPFVVFGICPDGGIGALS